MRPLLRLAPTLLLLSSAHADEVSLSLRAPSGDVVVLQVDAADGSIVSIPLALRGIRLLDVDVVGRTLVDGLRPDRAQRVAHADGSARLELPSDLVLHRFQRKDPQGTTFGFFVHTPGSEPQVVLERSGSNTNESNTCCFTRAGCHGGSADWDW